MVKPIFIFSLPRSGSTLLQRLLLASDQCATVGEPSLLLRLLGNDDMATRRSVYWEFLVDIGKQDMHKAWEGFDHAYKDGISHLMHKLYAGLAGNKPYFIDKTPRYSLIAKEIIQTFPNAYFIVLWRHPLAVAASMHTTSKRSYWFPDEHAIDLYEGINRLNQVCIDFKDRICEVRYEDLVVNTSDELKRVGRYLEIQNLESVVNKPLVSSNSGRLGDPTGIKKFKTVSTESLNAWIDVFDNFHRKKWAMRYASGNRAAIMKNFNYTIPDGFKYSQSFNFAGGIKDIFLASIRRKRKITNPVSHKRFLNEFYSKHGFFPTLR